MKDTVLMCCVDAEGTDSLVLAAPFPGVNTSAMVTVTEGNSKAVVFLSADDLRFLAERALRVARKIDATTEVAVHA